MWRNTIELTDCGARPNLRRVLVAATWATQLVLLPVAYGQSDVCAVDESDDSELCLASVLRVPLETTAVCDAEEKKARAERAELASEERDKQEARVRLVEAWMDDVEKAMPGDHTNLEENFDTARARDAEAIASEKELRVGEASDPCSAHGAPFMPLTPEDSVEILFRAPAHCLQTLQRARGGNLPVSIERLAAKPSDHAVAQLTEVATLIEGDVSMVQARATVDRPSTAMLDDNQVIVRLQCRKQ